MPGLLPESVTAARDAVSHRTDHQYLHRRFNGFVDVRDYGAVGDDSTDDTTAIGNAYTACPTGGQLYFPPNFVFKITSAITIAKSIEISGFASTLHQVTTGARAFTITASGVDMRGLTFQGPQTPGSIVYNGSEDAIVASGTSAAAPLTSLDIADCEMYGWGDGGLYCTFVNGSRVTDNYIHDIGYAGLAMLSPQRALISRNRIVTIGPGTAGNTYGLSVTRNATASLVTDPRATDIIIDSNIIENSVGWEGIDTHAGQRILVVNNTVRNCDQGIAMTTAAYGANVLSPIDCAVIGNLVDSTSTDGSRRSGIYFFGDPTEYTTGQVCNNTVIGHGKQDTSTQGGITIYYGRGMVIEGNYGRDCSPAAINFSSNCVGMSVMSNVSQDNWSTVVSNANGVSFSSSPNSGFVDGNIVVRGPKSATFVNTAAVFINTGNTVTSGTNLSF